MGEADGHEAGAAERGWLGLPGPVRWILRYALMAVVSIVLGRVVELVAEQVKHNTERVAESFAEAEKGAIASVGRLRPTALARLYLTALRPAPSPLFTEQRQLMDSAEAMARVRARIAAASPRGDAAANLADAEALIAGHRSAPIAPPGGAPSPRSLGAYVDSLPEPKGAAEASRQLSGSNSSSELLKAFRDVGAPRPATSFSKQLDALGPSPRSPPALSPLEGAPAAGASFAPSPAAPSILASPRPVSRGAPALDRALRPPPPENADAGASEEEQALGVRLHHWVGQGRGNWLSPVTALADVMWTLATRGAWAGRIVMFLQLLFGLVCAAPLIAWLGDDKRGGGAGGPIWLFGGPFLAVGLGSLVSLAVWAVMAGAHRVFGGFTHIPGLSVGIGTAGFCCWHVGWRATELALGHPVERLIERV